MAYIKNIIKISSCRHHREYTEILIDPAVQYHRSFRSQRLADRRFYFFHLRNTDCLRTHALRYFHKIHCVIKNGM